MNGRLLAVAIFAVAATWCNAAGAQGISYPAANQGIPAAATQAWPVTLATGGALNAVGNPIFISPGSGANLAEETGGNLAQNATDLGPPGATACATDTGSCSLNALLQRLAQRLTTVNTTLGSPFQAGGSIGNTAFGLTGASASAALSDILANPTTLGFGSYSLGWDATNTEWRRLQVDAATGTLKVDPGTVAVTGTFFQTTQPVSAASLPLPTGAATSANQEVTAAGTSATSAQGVQGVTGGVPLPVSGTVSVTYSSGTFAVKDVADMTGTTPGSAPSDTLIAGGIYNSSAPAPTTGQTLPFQLDSSGNLKVNIQSGSGSGGTSSSFAATYPSTGTAAGGEYLTSLPSYSTNGQMQPLTLDSHGDLNTDLIIGGAVVSATNGEYANLLQGNAALSATNGIYANLLQGNAALSSSNALFSKMTDGTNVVGVAPASTAPTATQPALVVGVSPNSYSTDGVAFTAGTTGGNLVNCEYQSTFTSNPLTTGKSGTVGCNAYRGQFADLLDSTGTELANTSLHTVPISQATAANLNATVVGSGVFEVGPTGSANTASNPFFYNLVVGGAVISATNGAYANLLQGNAVLSATNGLYANILQGNAALSVSNPGFTEVTDGTNGAVAVKPASTAAAATDKSLVVQINPEQTPPVQPAAGTTGGASSYYLSGGTTAGTNSNEIKTSAGTVYDVTVVNTTTTVAYLRMYNVSSAPTCSSATGVVHDYAIGAASATGVANGFVLSHPVGEAYATGIGFCLTGALGNTDTTNAPAGITVDVSYK